jgi:3-oxoacyl-[acyl-carrier protein] reductase
MNILVTGASRGVGLEICRVLLQQGHTVYCLSRTYTDHLKELQEKHPGSLHYKCIDLANAHDAQRLVFKEFVNNDIVLHGFVTNAAVAYDDIITNLSLSRLQDMYAVNVFTPMILTKYAIRNMLLHKTRGAIVHISSICVHTGYKGLAMYASTKGALEAFSKNTSREWGALGIRSNVVVPGFMETAMSSMLTTQQKEKIYNRTSLMKATDVTSVAHTVAFLLSEEAGSITGESINVDSGTI